MLLIADHAGNLVPRSLRQLGLPQSELERHIGIDIGILGVCRELSGYSRCHAYSPALFTAW